MKLVLNRNMWPIYFIMVLVIGFAECGPRKQVSPGVIGKLMTTELPLPIVPFKVDSPRNSPVEALSPADRPALSEIKNNASSSLNIDTLLKRNLELQRIAIRTLDRAHDVRLEKDSALALLKGIRSTVNSTQATLKAAKDSQRIVATTYNMMDYMILVCIGICTIASIIEIFNLTLHKHRNKKPHII